MSESTNTRRGWGDAPTPFEAVGGESVLRAVVEDFYDIIEAEAPLLRAMLPRDDSGSRKKLGDYLIEWTGGPELYTPERGHPKMRMRHLPFVITEVDATTWLACMAKALDANGVEGQVRSFLDERLQGLALHMVNTEVDDLRATQRRSLDLRTDQVDSP